MPNNENGEKIETKRGENSEPENLEDETKKLQQEVEEFKDKYLRVSAEFDNYRKRMDKNVQDMIDAAKRSIITEFLVILDNMEKAIDVSKEHKEAIIEGVELTIKSFKDLLKKHNIKTIEPKEEIFNPDIHEALAMQNSDNVPKNSILKTMEKGYIYKDKLLRAAKVIVSKGKEEKENINKEEI